ATTACSARSSTTRLSPARPATSASRAARATTSSPAAAGRTGWKATTAMTLLPVTAAGTASPAAWATTWWTAAKGPTGSTATAGPALPVTLLGSGGDGAVTIRSLRAASTTAVIRLRGGTDTLTVLDTQRQSDADGGADSDPRDRLVIDRSAVPVPLVGAMDA